MTVDEILRDAQRRGLRLVTLRQNKLGNWEAAYAVGPTIHAMVECLTPVDVLEAARDLAVTRVKEPAAPADVFD